MNIQIEHTPAEDFGTLVVCFGEDDSVSLSGYGHDMKLTLPMYAHEAQEIIDALSKLATTPAYGTAIPGA